MEQNETEDKKEQTRREPFNSMDLKGPYLLVIDKSDGSHDASPPFIADNARQGTLPYHENNGHQGLLSQRRGPFDGSHNVSPPTNMDNGRHVSPSRDSKVLNWINSNTYHVSDDVPQPATADNDRQ